MPNAIGVVDARVRKACKLVVRQVLRKLKVGLMFEASHSLDSFCGVLLSLIGSDIDLHADQIVR